MTKKPKLVHVRLPHEVRHALRIEAAKRDVSLVECAEQILRVALGMPPKEA